MHRSALQHSLELYAKLWQGSVARDQRAELHSSPLQSHLGLDQRATLAQMQKFIAGATTCFDRTHAPGHVTGSALVCSKDGMQVLLTLHRKLGKWLQLGGHADGDSAVEKVAMREAEEESGLKTLAFFDYRSRFTPVPLTLDEQRLWPVPFDIDVHEIPGRRGEPAHLHYDVRYLIIGDPLEPLVVSGESKDLRWLSLAEAGSLTEEPSMHRQFAKLAWLIQRR